MFRSVIALAATALLAGGIYVAYSSVPANSDPSVATSPALEVVPCSCGSCQSTAGCKCCKSDGVSCEDCVCATCGCEKCKDKGNG